MAWGIWAIITLVLLIAETLTVDFLFMMFAGGTIGAAITSAIAPDNLFLQIIVFSVISLLGVAFIRPWARRHVNDSSKGESNVYAMAGQVGHALTDIDTKAGRVKIGGDVWSAKTYGPAIAEGTTVVVQHVEGARAVVQPFHAQQAQYHPHY
ncbi:membrane protein implicated in regulation of membrane protease activity [Trueperella bonasi]|uniref:Membrane protein implicated in regulation of membrane protease activity n=1 Tax=Trueperella bonasi TaxID=312286 RepID=A0ABT9NEB0_9ACTO|nr:NfeD family protein [Trueperella bonasi]MDP9805545.1 membrane protein implicated in regulation of membrane protease activity [Trueperella bonasi]